MSGDEAVWSAVLTAYEARLDDVVAAVTAGRPDDVPPFEGAPDLPPLPPSHRRRAEELLQQSAALEQVMEQRLAAIAAGPRGGHDQVPSFVDARS